MLLAYIFTKFSESEFVNRFGLRFIFKNFFKNKFNFPAPINHRRRQPCPAYQITAPKYRACWIRWAARRWPHGVTKNYEIFSSTLSVPPHGSTHRAPNRYPIVRNDNVGAALVTFLQSISMYWTRLQYLDWKRKKVTYIDETIIFIPS